MVTRFDVPQQKLVEEVARKLKEIKEIEPPAWAYVVKTGHFKERAPVDKDWWYMRCAAVLRKVSLKGPVGVEKLRTLFGGKKNRGMKPERFYKASGNIIRKMLQQLQKAELVNYAEKGVHKGRIAAPKGVSLLDRAAYEVYKKHLGKKSSQKEESQKQDSSKGSMQKAEPDAKGSQA